MELLKKVKETIRKYSQLSEGDCVLVGLSGGPDSVCLAVILDKLRKDFNLSLHAMYIDHGLRPEEAEKEKDFCREFCASLGIQFHTGSVNVSEHAREKGIGIQEAARELRYNMLEETAGRVNASRIALGHNADDRAETFLMNMLRGTGRRGLSGIPPVRQKIIRPLIGVQRDEIEQFLSGESQGRTMQPAFMVDSSNLKKDYFRNWIRLSVMPELKKKNPSLVQGMCRTMDIIREEDDYLELIVTKTLMRLISRKTSDEIVLFLSPLETTEKPVLRRVLRRAADATEGLRRMDFVHIEEVIGLIRSGRPGDRLDLPDGIRAVREYAVLKITSIHPVRIGQYELTPPGEVDIPGANIRINALYECGGGHGGDSRASVLLDAGIMRMPLVIRCRREGDFFFPAGFGKKKKLQDFFVDQKVPRDERDSVPVVVSGDDIVWVAGYRADERFRATERTEKFLRLIISRL